MSLIQTFLQLHIYKKERQHKKPKSKVCLTLQIKISKIYSVLSNTHPHHTLRGM